MVRPVPVLVWAAVFGLISSSAFAPLRVPYAMVIGVAGLIWLARRLATARRGLVLAVGAVYGFAFMAVLIWWMIAVAINAYVGLVVVQTAFFAVIMLTLRAVSRLRAWPVLLPAVWVLDESIRGAVPFSGFPWGRLGHTSLDTAFESFVRIGGVPLASFLLALVACLVVWFGERLRSDVRTANPALVLLPLPALIVVGALLPLGAPATAGEYRVAVVQGGIPGPFGTWRPADLFAMHVAQTRKLLDRIETGDEPRPDLVLWPENAVDIDPYRNPEIGLQITELATDLGVPILVGGIYDAPTDGELLNTGQLWTADGPGQLYIKRELVPYGEYVPYRDHLGVLSKIFESEVPVDMVPGDQPGRVAVGDTLLADTICWDVAYDHVVRQAVTPQTGFIVVQTSNAAFTDTPQPEQQWDITRLRAIEHGRPVVVPSTNGVSGVIDAKGSVVVRTAMHVPDDTVQTLRLSSGTTPAETLAPWTTGLLSGVGVLALLLAAVRRLGARRPDSTT